MLHSVGWPAGIGSLTVLWVHVATALVLVPLAIWHVLARKTLPRRQDLTRRNLIRTGGLVSVAVVAWFAADRAIALARLPGADRRFTGSHERSSLDPAGLPVTSWLDDQTPDIDAASWSVAIGDAAGGRLLGLDDLAVLPMDEVTAILDCTSGWYSNQVWRGVRLDQVGRAGNGSQPGRVVGHGIRQTLPGVRPGFDVAGDRGWRQAAVTRPWLPGADRGAGAGAASGG